MLALLDTPLDYLKVILILVIIVILLMLWGRPWR